jgi:hypothetical protein
MESLYRAYTARCILFQTPMDCGQLSLLTSSWPNALRFPRALLCSFPYTDFAEFIFQRLYEK